MSPALRERRQKLRRVVTWVVGGAAALMCVGLICGAIRAHSLAVALAEASAEAAPALAAPTPPSTPTPSAATSPADTSTVTAAAPPSTVASAAPKLVKKPALHAKSKHSTTKSALTHH